MEGFNLKNLNTHLTGPEDGFAIEANNILTNNGLHRCTKV